MKCWHGDVHGDGHLYDPPRCPANVVRSWDHLLSAARAAEATDDAPGIMAILLAAGGAGVSASQQRR